MSRDDPASATASSAADASRLRLAEAVEAAAYREFLFAAPPELASQLGLVTRELRGATLLMASGIPDPFFNRVIGFGVHEPASEDGLEAVIEAYREAGTAAWWLHLTPIAVPEALPSWLERRGFALAQRSRWAKVARGCEPAPEVRAQVEVRRARPDEAAAVADAICSAYGMPEAFAGWFEAVQNLPNWRTYAAFEGAHVLGAGMLFQQGGTAWLGAGGVRPEARGRHLHRALMALRVDEAVGAGSKHLFTETGEPLGDEPNPSLANMTFWGFEKLCSRLNYAAPRTE